MKMKIYSKSVAILSAAIVIGSAIAQPQNQHYKYNQDEVKEVYLKNAYKTGPRSYKSIRGYVPSIMWPQVMQCLSTSAWQVRSISCRGLQMYRCRLRIWQ